MRELRPFSPVHLAILAAVPALAAALAAWVRGSAARSRAVRLALAAALASAKLVQYALLGAAGGVSPPHGLPLELCDVAGVLAFVALVRPVGWILDVVYYVALGGTAMALLTPDVGAPWPSWPAATFFVAHGLVVTSVLFLVWTDALVPRPGAWWRAMLPVDAYALVLLLVDLRFRVNYMYLLEKPASGTLLDAFGPWPWYLVGGEALGVVLFLLLDLPFRRRRGQALARSGPASGRPGVAAPRDRARTAVPSPRPLARSRILPLGAERDGFVSSRPGRSPDRSPVGPGAHGGEGGWEMAVDIKQAYRRLMEEAFGNGNLDVFGEVCDPVAYRSHDPLTGESDLAGQKESCRMYRRAFPDLRPTILAIYADGDTVILAFRMTGTHRGEFMSVPATGKVCSAEGIAIGKFRGGRLVDDYVQWDVLGVLRQIGAAAATQAGAGAAGPGQHPHA